MHYLLKNTQRLVIISSLLLGTLGYFSLSLNAQVPFDAKKLAEQDADKNLKSKTTDLFGNIDINKIFSKDKGGCGMKLSTFFVMSGYYKGGTKVEDVADSKIFEPLIKGVYDEISKSGVEKATIDAMKEFKSCLSTVKSNKSDSIEYDLNLKYKPCGKLNSAMLDVLDYIKKRRDIDSVVKKYERENIDFTGTTYEDVPSPITLFAGQISSIANDGSEYKNAVGTALGVVIVCYR